MAVMDGGFLPGIFCLYLLEALVAERLIKQDSAREMQLKGLSVLKYSVY